MSRALSSNSSGDSPSSSGSSSSSSNSGNEDSNNSNSSSSSSSDDEDNIDTSWQRRLVSSNLGNSQQQNVKRLPLKHADGSIVRNKAFDGEGGQAVVKQSDMKNKDEDENLEDEPSVPETNVKFKNNKHIQRDIDDDAIDENLPRPVRVEQYKMRIAMLAEAIIRDPASALKHSKTETAKFDKMHRICTNNDFTIRRLGIVSLYAVFKDILPPFRIRVVTDVEMQSQMKKETRARREFEKSMLSVYQRYLKVLDSSASNVTKEEQCKMSESKYRRRIRLIHASLTCMGLLIVARPKFNFRSNILSLLVSRLADDNTETQKIIMKQIESILIEDRTSEIAVEIVRAVSKLVKNKNYVVNTNVLNCLLEVPLKTDLKDKKIKKMQEKRGKKKRKMGELAKNLQITSGSIDVNARNKNQVIVLKDLFNMYFRVLKRSVPSSPLIGAAMHGVAKFSHLINIDIVYDLVEVLSNMCKADGMAVSSGIQCVLAALRTLAGPGKELNFDDGPFIAYLYKIVPRLSAISEDTNVGTAMMCLQLAFLKRREHSMERVAAFIKRLAMVSLHFTRPEHAMAALSIIGSIFQRYPTTTQLLDRDDERKACPDYLYNIDDPEQCHSFGATLFEVTALTKHFHPGVQEMAKNVLLRKMPLPSHQPRLLLKDYDTTLCGFNNTKIQPPPERTKKEIIAERKFIEEFIDMDEDNSGNDDSDDAILNDNDNQNANKKFISTGSSSNSNIHGSSSDNMKKNSGSRKKRYKKS